MQTSILSEEVSYMLEKYRQLYPWLLSARYDVIQDSASCILSLTARGDDDKTKVVKYRMYTSELLGPGGAQDTLRPILNRMITQLEIAKSGRTVEPDVTVMKTQEETPLTAFISFCSKQPT